MIKSSWKFHSSKLLCINQFSSFRAQVSFIHLYNINQKNKKIMKCDRFQRCTKDLLAAINTANGARFFDFYRYEYGKFRF